MEPKSSKFLDEVYQNLAVRMFRVYEDMSRLHGMKMRATEGLRSMERQKELWDQGRTQPGPIVTYSQPGLSLHHYGCAVDSCFVGSDPFLAKLKDGQMFWDEFGRIAQGYGLVWGGAWSKGVDRPHCQFTYGHTVQELVEIYKIGGLEGCFKSYDKWMASH